MLWSTCSARRWSRLRVLHLIWVAATGFAAAQAAMAAGGMDAVGLATGRYVETVGIYEKRIREAGKDTARDLAPLCWAQFKLKRYEAIFSCAKRLDAIVAAGDRHHRDWPSLASDLAPMPHTLRAVSLLDLGNHAEAIAAGEKALSLLGDSDFGNLFPPQLYKVEVLPVLGIASILAGDKARAEKYAKELESMYIGFVGMSHVQNWRKIGLAKLHLALGNYEAAAKASESEWFALGRFLADAFVVAGANESFAVYYDLARQMIHAKAEIGLGRFDAARESLDRVIAGRRITEQADIYWIALAERAALAEKAGKPAEAVPLLQRAVEVIEQLRASIATEASKIGFVGDKQAVYERLIALLVDQGRPADAFDYVERSKARALVDMLASKKDFATTSADAGRARLVLAQLDAADSASRLQGTAAPVGAATRTLTLARQELQQSAPELSSLVSVSSVAPEELKALLGDDEALVEYYYQGRDLYAFVLDRQRVAAFRLDAAGLSDEIQAFRRSLQEPASKAWQQGAQALHKRLWQPLEASIAARKLILVAHGALHYLPFAALQAGDGSLVIDRYSARFLPSASVLKFLRPPATGKDGLLLAFGNPDLGDASLELKFAEIEAQTVAQLFPQSRVLVRKDASETNFRKAGAVFSRIHFATHGKFHADNPLSSGLFLARDAENDGVLSVGELYSMQLDADLVTLSACETGLGRITNGDDVVGLTRGFLYAGARSIVASLWSVDDKATAGLMQAFYENLSKQSKQDALRDAQLRTRRDYPHPFYWVAFQLTGRAD